MCLSVDPAIRIFVLFEFFVVTRFPPLNPQ